MCASTAERFASFTPAESRPLSGFGASCTEAFIGFKNLGRFSVQVAPDAIEYVPSLRVIFGQARVVEVVCRVMRHTEFLHDAPGAEVALGGEGDDLASGAAQDFPGAFRCQSP